MESKWAYQLTQKADADLDDIAGYIAVELANPTAASAFVDKLQKAVEEARIFPESGALVDNEFTPSVEIRKKPVGNYMMYYLPDSDEKKIYILRIVYGRRNMDRILQRL